MSDLIDRQQAIDALHVYFNIHNLSKIDLREYLEETEMIINHIVRLQKIALRELPSAKPETVKWIKRTGTYQVGYKCSKCGKFSLTLENFCPNCGSDMRSNKDE